MATLLIAGCGDVGSALARLRVAAGDQVWGLRRGDAGLPPGVRGLRADLGAGPIDGLPSAIDAVVYAAAADRRDDESYRRTYVDGVGRLAVALTRAGAAPRRWVYVSSTAVYGQAEGEWVDEDAPTLPSGFNGRRMIEGERCAAATGIPTVVVRFGGIYGPGRGWLVERVRAGAGCRARPPLYTNRIHRDDCAAVLDHLLSLESPARCYLGVDDAPAPQCEVMDWIADRIGVPRPPRTGAVAGGAGKRCSNRRLRASGYCFGYPSYRDGYAAMLGRSPQ